MSNRLTFAVALAFVLLPSVRSARAHAQWTESVTVRHAAYDVENAPSALVHAPAGFDATRPLHLVVFLHGYMGCAEVLMRDGAVSCKAAGALLTGWNLARAHDSAGTSTLFVIPQLAFMKRSGRPGCFARQACFRTFLQEVLAALPSTRVSTGKILTDVASITLVAHSAGYRAALAILEHGEIDALVRDVVLLDALYGEPEAFLAWAALGRSGSRRLLSLHIGAGTPAQHSARLLRMARRRFGSEAVAKLDTEIEGPSLTEKLRGKRVVIAKVAEPHREVPAVYLGRVVKALEASRAGQAENGKEPRTR